MEKYLKKKEEQEKLQNCTSEKLHHQIILLVGMSNKKEVSQSAYINENKKFNYSFRFYICWNVQ